MLGPFALAVFAVTTLVTSFISGIFGMAGGIILLGVLLLYMDVAPAMVLFGAIQTSSNGWRGAVLGRAVGCGGREAGPRVAAHLYRIVYFGSFTAAFDTSIPWWASPTAIVLSLAGTSLAATVL